MLPRGCLGFGRGKHGLSDDIVPLQTAAVFIDGSNFYHSLKSEGALPFGDRDFDTLFAELSKLFQVKKIFFYDAVKDSSKDLAGYSSQQNFHSKLKKLKWPIEIRTRKLRYLTNITQEQIDYSAKAVGIVDSCKYLLFKFLQSLGLIRLTKEKGIDVLLVADAIELARAKKSDAIILLSGDADFVPAISLIREFGVHTINLHTYSGSSSELRNTCDGHMLIDFRSGKMELKAY